jgi:hypothetical protein
VGRFGQVLLPFSVVVAEYLLAAGALYGFVQLAQPPPHPGCVDSCWGGAVLDLALLFFGMTDLVIGLLVALTMLAVLHRRARRAAALPESILATVSTATRVAGRGGLWALLALPLLCVGELPLLKFVLTVFS